MMAYPYANIKNYLRGIAFKGRLAYAMWAGSVGTLQGQANLPKRLKSLHPDDRILPGQQQVCGGTERPIERFVDEMFLRTSTGMSVSWWMGFPNSGAMLRAPMDTKQIQVMAAEIYSVRSVGQDFCRLLGRGNAR
jgi:hypothetical protein